MPPDGELALGALHFELWGLSLLFFEAKSLSLFRSWNRMRLFYVKVFSGLHFVDLLGGDTDRSIQRHANAGK